MSKRNPNPIDVHVGNRVRMQRMLVGMSQEKLGEHLGLTFQQVQKYEKGSNRVSASKLYQMAQVLGVPVQFFYEDLPGSRAEANGPGLNDQGSSQSEIMGFLGSSEAIQLNRAFSEIGDVSVRRRVVDLVKAIAKQD
ncbi:MAG TPA: helix-turn-helix transcriptional regulator [Aestuariivirgaceae bacterium]|jgi:transcriptional regulator with XRE-family HTH domain|nr:helix-turn-helix transcriptional regulator [Aestuariivirgaceae bacterium]